jgi:hypothetical protein
LNKFFRDLRRIGSSKEINISEINNVANQTNINNKKLRINKNMNNSQYISNDKLNKLKSLSSTDNFLKISYYNILIPFNLCKSKKMIRKYDKYAILKDYVFKKISIKEVLLNADEFERLKFYMLESHEIEAIENLERPLANKYGLKSLWLPSGISKN